MTGRSGRNVLLAGAVFPLAIYISWLVLLVSLLLRRDSANLRLLAAGTVFGGPGEYIGAKIGAFYYLRPTLPDHLYGGVAPYWAPFGWGAALTGISLAATAIRSRFGLSDALGWRLLTSFVVTAVTILPGEALAVRLGVWRWDHPEKLPIARFHNGLGIPLDSFIPPALISLVLAHLAGAARRL